MFVLPFDSQRKRFTIVEEFHPGPNRRMYGLIAGMKESKHESLRQAAIWELSEEGRLKLGRSPSSRNWRPARPAACRRTSTRVGH